MRVLSTSSSRAREGRPPTSSPSTARPTSTAAHRSSSCGSWTGRETIARHYLYEEADAKRLEQLKQSDDPEIAGLAAKIDREEAYHRIHAQMWFDRLQDEPRFVEALERLRPQAEALLDSAQRGEHTAELADLWEEMTMVRRSQPAGTKW